MNQIDSPLQKTKQLEFNPPKIVQYLFLLYILLKPFYIFESGSFQPSDAVFMVCFCLFLYFLGTGSLILSKFDYILIVFCVWVFIINFIYFSLYRDTEFLYSSLYYIFNLFLVLVARYLLLNKEFIKKLFWTCRMCLYIQVAIALLGLGKYYMESNDATDRYLGTFNDPNQLAFYAFALLMAMFMIDKIYGVKRRIWLVDYAAFVYLLYLSASTGLLLAFGIFGALYILILIASPVFEQTEERKTKLYTALIGIFLLAIVLIIYWDEVLAFAQKSELFSRILEKETLSTSTTATDVSGSSIWQDRNIDKLYLYPQYNIFGAGQGYFQRFWMAHSSGEIHSTIFSVLFCYGIGPTLLFIYWCWTNLRHSTVYFIPVFVALIVESTTLLNQRQPLFWILFLLAYAYRIMEDRRYEDDIYT